MLYDPADQRDLVRAVGAVVADRHRRLLGEAAREHALTRTWDDAVAELLERHLSPLASARA